MDAVLKTIAQGAHGKHANAVLYASMLGLVVSDIVPTPADALYFLIEKKLKDQVTAGTITPKEYWTKTAIYYYTLNPIWWIGVLLVTANVQGFENKLKIGFGLVGAGAVLGVIGKNIKSDMAQMKEKVEG